MTLRVVQVMRRPQGGNNYSIEGLFAAVRAAIPPDITVDVAMAPYVSNGLSRRLMNVAWATQWHGRLVHVTGDIAYITPALGRRAVITIHDVGWIARRRLAQAVYDTAWISIPVRSALIVTTVSEFTRRGLMQQVACPSDKIRVVPNCYDPAFVPAPARPWTKPVTVLSVGTTANKNLERLCAAMEGLGCVLHVVGPVSALQRAALSRHNIEYRNSVALNRDDLVRSYHDADLVALPSLYEGFGLPIIEGQATGRPVLTSSVTAMPDVAGDAACFVDPYDVGSIRAGLLRLLGDTEYRAELRERGFENVQQFGARVVAAKYADIYREAAESLDVA